ncbi:PDZ and LIM domain protein 5 isoform ENH1e [Mus musculus]|uniref:ENH isoform 1e n=1 Tax=Mus musculus TaxID=10090 RepID=D9J302_MOUSE|nr:PDZ and LIM domain protein 5 isoform ENH1e [Mus musculus]ADI88507.1 ENH isoform 1e [Mus musculus]|eukprot:NP_001177781.1 PDZ and LIM domain protein 5 isoform ENH1e [Mus musculus]
MSNYSVSLVGPAPWGFRLQGGKDFNMPLTISSLKDGGKASQAHVRIGDVVLSIDGISAQGMTHLEAQNKIKACTGSLNMTLQRASAAAKSEPVSVQKPTVTSVCSESAQELAEGQRRGSQGDIKQQNGPPRKHIVERNTEFYHIPTHSDASKKRLIEDTEDWRPRTGTTQSRSFRILAQITGTEHLTESENDNTKKAKFYSSLEDPLKNGPHPPAAPQLLKVHSQVAIVSKEAATYSSVSRSTRTVEGALEGFGNFPAFSPPTRYSAVVVSDAAATVSAALAAKTRLFGPENSQSLLDALCISTVPKPLALSCLQSSEESSGSVHVKKSSSTQEPSQQPASSGASPLSASEGPESPGSSRPSVAGLRSAAAFKPVGSTSVKSPSWQRPNQAAPSTGRISNNARSSGTGASVGPPQPSDQDTLVQRAEHIPAGKRTPMCAHCNQVIRGPFLVALGKSWHPEEFNCAHCKNTMAYIGFVEEKGALYCELCYEKFFAPECGRCQRKILGEVINALKQTWHVSCFVCVACGKPIRNNVFHLEDGEPYCETDYYALFGTICRGCEFPIEAGDMFLEALGYTWHDTCFVCSVCCESLEGQTFFSKKDKPLCKKHAHSVNF